MAESIENSVVNVKEICQHCKDPIEHIKVVSGDFIFCCEGCKTVFEILNQNDLCAYYDLDSNPGISLKGKSSEDYTFLDIPEEADKYLSFRSEKLHSLQFFIPSIHCSSCIWLLENLNKLVDGVLSNRVNFLDKKLYLDYDPHKTNIRKIVEILDTIGYKPDLTEPEKKKNTEHQYEKQLLFKIGVAGFGFGNIMLFSFPEYLGLEDTNLQTWFSYLNILLSIPILFYSGWMYPRSAWQALRKGVLNIDVPITLGMVALFGRSIYEITTQTGPGYLDSFAGLIFFLLIGRWYQNKTYKHINFERDYKSYFPISVLKHNGKTEEQVPLSKIESGDTIIIKNNQVIPGDVILLSDHAAIDYSFVTGESDITPVFSGEKIYAGGKLKGPAVRVSVLKKIENSYLIKLWNTQNADKIKTNKYNLTDQISKYFTIAILLIATLALAYWWNKSVSTALTAAVSVLIIACPCALALSIPFIYGNMIRLLARRGIFLKSSGVVEQLSKIDLIVFDKTGTLTNDADKKVHYSGEALNFMERKWVHAVCFQSIHPLSMALEKLLRPDVILLTESFEEIAGLGMKGEVDGHRIKIGSAKFLGVDSGNNDQDTRVFIEIDGHLKGYYTFKHSFRAKLQDIVSDLKNLNYNLALLSGDTDKNRSELVEYFGLDFEMHFKQNPADKMSKIKSWQNEPHQVAMIGDGLNDTAALRQSDVGIVITDDVNNFTPEGDVVFASSNFSKIGKFFYLGKAVKKLVIGAYSLAFLYNVVGLSFAVSGQLSPVIAAILMPISSVTIVFYALISTSIFSQRILK